MFKAPAATESKRRPLAAIGSERAARLAAIGNQDLGQALAPPDNLNPCPPQANCWPTCIGSERAARLVALRTLSLPLEDNDCDISFCVCPDINWSGAGVLPGWQADPLTEGHPRPGHSFWARFIENLDPDHDTSGPRDNLNLSLLQAGGARTPSPPRALAADPLEALRYLNLSDGLAAWSLDSSSQDNDGDTSFLGRPDARWSGASVLPGWQTDSPTGGHSQSDHQQKLESILQAERVPHPDRNPLPPPPTPTTSPEGFYLMLDNSPVQAESPWLSMLPNWQGTLPELPLPLNDDRVWDDLHRAQAINNRLVERILSQMPDGQSRRRFQCELLRQQLGSEQRLTGFLEGKLGQVPAEPESQCPWMSWLGGAGGASDASDAGGAGDAGAAGDAGDAGDADAVGEEEGLDSAGI